LGRLAELGLVRRVRLVRQDGDALAQVVVGRGQPRQELVLGDGARLETGPGVDFTNQFSAVAFSQNVGNQGQR
jgi:hypothetical protein